MKTNNVFVTNNNNKRRKSINMEIHGNTITNYYMSKGHSKGNIDKNNGLTLFVKNQGAFPPIFRHDY